MALTSNLRRGLSLAISLFTALFLIGIIPSIFGLTPTQSLWGSGLTLNTIFAIANGYLWYLVFKHQVP